MSVRGGRARIVVLLSAFAQAFAWTDHAAWRTLQVVGDSGGNKCAVDPATDQKVSDEWCEVTCRPSPDAVWCKGVCKCPKLKPAAKPSVTPAANKPAAKPIKQAAQRHSSPLDRCIVNPQTDQKVSDEWCEGTCGASPEADWCKGVCECPTLKPAGDLAGASEPPEPPPPNPRILGGWTDCGPNSGKSGRYTEKLRLQRGKWGGGAKKRLDKFGNCSKDEEEILAALPDDHQLGEIRREPSYSHAWGANAILPGRFGGSEIAPIIGSAGSYKYFWLTFGGQNTDSGNWMARAEQDIVEAGAMGAAFDIEGGVYPRDMLKWIKDMRVKHPQWSYVHVPQADDTPIKYNPEAGSPDYVAPMMYYGNYNSYPKMDVSDVDGVGTFGRGGGESLHALKGLKEAGWPASRTILTYQSFDAARIRTGGDKKTKMTPNRHLLKLLGKLLGNHSIESKTWGSAFKLQGPYAGVLGWPAQCGKGDMRCWPEADEANLKEVIEGARTVGVEFAEGV